MSETAKSARKAMKDKAHRMANGDPHAVVDASGWREAEPLNADVKTGMRPVTRRGGYKRGGKVEGRAEPMRADRKPRKSGGAASLANAIVNRDVKAANEEREGVKHRGGMANGGAIKVVAGRYVVSHPKTGEHWGTFNTRDHAEARAKAGPPPGMKRGGHVKGGHSDAAEDKALIARKVKAECRTKRKHGGRADAHWIKDAIGHKGALHHTLHVPEGEKIPAKKLEKAEHSGSALTRKRAHLAETLRGMHHKARGGEVDEGYFSGAPKTAPDHHMIRALQEHGVEHSYKNGVLHAHIPYTERNGEGGIEHVPIGNSVRKLRDALGYKRGGSVSDGELEGTRPTGGRLARKSGGRTGKGSGKGKMNVNIVIASPDRGGGAPAPMGAVGPPMPVPPPQRPVQAMPTGGAPMSPPAMMAAMTPQPRKRGGRVATGGPEAKRERDKVAREMADHGGGGAGGLGRLEKIKAYREARRGYEERD